jgi:hypothetical protein
MGGQIDFGETSVGIVNRNFYFDWNIKNFERWTFGKNKLFGEYLSDYFNIVAVANISPFANPIEGFPYGFNQKLIDYGLVPGAIYDPVNSYLPIQEGRVCEVAYCGNDQGPGIADDDWVLGGSGNFSLKWEDEGAGEDKQLGMQPWTAHEFLGHAVLNFNDEYGPRSSDFFDGDSPEHAAAQRRYSGAHTGEKLMDIDYTTTIPNEWNIAPKTTVLWEPLINKPGYYENWLKEGYDQKYNEEGTEYFAPGIPVYSYGYDFMRNPAVSYNHLVDWNGWFRFCAWKKMQSLASSKHMKIINPSDGYVLSNNERQWYDDWIEDLNASWDEFFEWDETHLNGY